MSDWLRYEWEWEQSPITIQVDLQYWPLLPTLAYSHLIYVACAPRNSFAESFTRAEEKALSALYDALLDRLQGGALHVGFLETSTLRQYYFYTNDPSLLNQASSLCRAETKLRTTCGQVEEPHYATYYRFLFPDDAKLQSVENAEYIREVSRRGGDLTLVRRIEMTLAFPSFEGRESFIHALPQIGLAVGVTETAQHPTHPYRVTVRGYSTLLLPDLNRCTARAIREAATHDGILEKIDADFIEKH
ncbi:MAG: DUF695 domain-containing protein [Clostridia bacterium]|jgi:hypothetical protein|nr:DUF695 domain-containing protein [Clostridia bacterium]